MNYLLVDESDPKDYFECEGQVLETFFDSTKMFCSKTSTSLIRTENSIEDKLKRNKSNYYNIVQFSAHGFYAKGLKRDIDYTGFVRRRGKVDVEIFRPDSIVRTGLKADLFVSTNCETFNPLFIDVLRHYRGVSNYIAPVNKPYAGNTLIFSMMLYNQLLRNIRYNSSKICDDSIISSFKTVAITYKKYVPQDEFRLFNVRRGKVYH